MQQDIEQQLEQVKDAWGKITNVPPDLSPWGFAGLTKQSISDALGGMVEIAGLLNKKGDFEPEPTSRAYFNQTLTNLRQHVIQHIPGNPQPHIPGLLQLIELTRSTLRSWLSEADKKGKYAIPVLAERLAESVSRMDDAAKLYEEIAASHNSAQESLTQIESDVAEIAKQKKEVDGYHVSVVTDSGEVGEVLKKVRESAEQIKTLVADFVNLKDELEENKKTQAKLFEQFEGYRQRVNDLLGDANRTGMAASFVNRKNELVVPLRIWAGVFGLSIFGLGIMALLYVVPSLSSGKWEELVFRLPLTAPLVWLGWFSAKQYGYTVRLREDYAYKVASAMSFEGFKREATEDEEMQRKLLDTAIQHFGDNPLRIYNGHENHASPIHELLEKSLRDEKFIDLLKAVIAKAKPA